MTSTKEPSTKPKHARDTIQAGTPGTGRISGMAAHVPAETPRPELSPLSWRLDCPRKRKSPEPPIKAVLGFRDSVRVSRRASSPC